MLLPLTSVMNWPTASSSVICVPRLMSSAVLGVESDITKVVDEVRHRSGYMLTEA